MRMLPLLLCAMLCAACARSDEGNDALAAGGSGGIGGRGGAGGSGSTGGSGGGDVRSDYPSGPYGVAAGDVITDLSFQAPDGGPFALGDVYADPANRVLLLTTLAGWSTACIEEQPILKAMHAEYGERGLAIVAALFEDAESAPATLEQAAAWASTYQLPYTLVLDQAFQLGAYYDPAATPMNMLLDVDTMQILSIQLGFDEITLRAIIEDNLD